MKIKRLVIENFKSIERIELIEPNPFTVFVGPNGSGKSNIFEALEFVNTVASVKSETAIRLFRGEDSFLNRNQEQIPIRVEFSFVPEQEVRLSKISGSYRVTSNYPESYPHEGPSKANQQFFANFCRLFCKNGDLVKIPFKDDERLSLDANNLEPVLKRILANDILKNEVFEWLELFIPGFKAVEVDDRNELHWFEQFSPDYFTKDLISDGTYNILALLTAVYQSDDTPQFLCIEEPENGLHPQVLMTLVDFFRQQCEEKGHCIWLNTHSESLVRKLQPEEIVLVNKREGSTQIKQIKDRNLYDLQMDEAWLTGALGGGLPW